MSYEKEIYSEMWSRLPGPGTKIKTENGVYILESIDVGQEQVNIRFPTGRLIPVAISEFPDFNETVLRGEEWGEDKEMAEKKRKAAERIAAIKARAERLKSSRLKVNAKSLRPKLEKKADSPKPKSKGKSQKPANAEASPKPRHRKYRKPQQKTEE